jgi:predicted RNA binding protein YcfA (HicA-like mRNA interferase family)
LEKHGWVLVRIRGAHHAYQRPGHPATLIVPVHGNDDLKPGTQHAIMRDAGLTEDDL